MCQLLALHIGRDYKRQKNLCQQLQTLGIELHKVSNISKAKKLAQKNCYRLILINFDSTDSEILEFCNFVRLGTSQTILIPMMSKVNVATEEKLFDAGVNDVVIGRQASSKVLIKRIKAHLRYSQKPSWFKTNTIRIKDTIIDFENRQVWCNGTNRRLPGILADLLKYFVENPDRVISREELSESSIWADSICSDPKEGGKTFDVNISKLKKIIEPDPANPQIIISVRGIGWRLADNLAN